MFYDIKMQTLHLERLDALFRQLGHADGFAPCIIVTHVRRPLSEDYALVLRAREPLSPQAHFEMSIVSENGILWQRTLSVSIPTDYGVYQSVILEHRDHFVSIHAVPFCNAKRLDWDHLNRALMSPFKVTVM